MNNSLVNHHVFKKISWLLILVLLLSACVMPMTAQGAVDDNVTIRYTINGARANYCAGSALKIYGIVEQGGRYPVPNADVFLTVVNESNSETLLYTQTTSDDNGFFGAYFTIPPRATVGDKITTTIRSADTVITGHFLVDTPVNGVNFVGTVAAKLDGTTLGSGYVEGSKEVLINTTPTDIRMFGLVFTANTNYYYNQSAAADIKNMGINEKNTDCFRLYKQKNNNWYEIPFNIIMEQSHATGGDVLTNYYTTAGSLAEATKRCVIYLRPTQSVEDNAAYKVTISKELTANNSHLLGHDYTVYFKTQAEAVPPPTPPVTPGGGGGGGGGASAEPAVSVDLADLAVVTKVDNIWTIILQEDKIKQLLDSAVMKDKTILTLDISAVGSSVIANKKVIINDNIVNLLTDKKKKLSFQNGDNIFQIPSYISNTVGDTQVKFYNILANTVPSFPDTVIHPSLVGFSVNKGVEEIGKFKSGVGHVVGLPANVDSKEKVQIYGLNEDKQWQLIPSKVQGMQVTFTTDLTGPFLVGELNIALNDLRGHWAQEDIEYLLAKGIVKGNADNLFLPNDKITRAEFTAFMVRLLDLQAEAALNYSDVKKGQWFAADIAKATKAGLVSGYEDGFHPNAYITREEVAVMMMRAAAYRKLTVETKKDMPFTDSNKISAWAKDAVNDAYSLGLINGVTSTVFAAQDCATRAQSVVMIKRLADLLQ